MIYTTRFDTLWVKDRAARNQINPCGFRPKRLSAETGEWRYDPEYPVFHDLRLWLADYFSGNRPEVNGFGLRLNPAGTPFQQSVWKLLLNIPYGQTRTYGELAREFAVGAGLSSMSAQAVGQAVAHNPISVIIPCHRVIGAGNHLTDMREDWTKNACC
jgi:methylated-DNA-[protein]-cysteine S-methyltransferase